MHDPQGSTAYPSSPSVPLLGLFPLKSAEDERNKDPQQTATFMRSRMAECIMDGDIPTVGCDTSRNWHTDDEGA